MHLGAYLGRVGIKAGLVSAGAMPVAVVADWRSRTRLWELIFLLGFLVGHCDALTDLPRVEGSQQIAQAHSSSKHFKPLQKSAVPPVLIAGERCPEPDTTAECRQRFKHIGRAWTGDVNDDGVDELLIEPGTGGSGGQDMDLFQRRGGQWVSILTALPYLERLDILPTTRNGYHDLHLDSLHCYKWSGEGYVGYDVEDYRKLRPEFFNASDPRNSSILWLSRYAGLTQSQLEPHWFPFEKKTLARLAAELDDPEGRIHWLAESRGGVWGVQENRAFLLLPRPAYKGCERLEFDGEWLVIYGAKGGGYGDPTPVARYNRRTQSFILVGEALQSPYWLDPA
jgi:hypothetical protein